VGRKTPASVTALYTARMRRAVAIPTDVKPGDIIGFSGFYLHSALVNLGSLGIPFWSISHVGILAQAPDGRLLLWESSEDDSRCEITGLTGSGVKAHDLTSVVEEYRGSVWHYPLYRPLYSHENSRLTAYLLSVLDKPYDQIGAVRSGGLVLSVIESFFREQDLSSLFCSETVAATYAYLGLFQTVNASRWSPNRLMRRLRRAEIVGAPRRIK